VARVLYADRSSNVNTQVRKARINTAPKIVMRENVFVLR
jgi:hypothetical protein